MAKSANQKTASAEQSAEIVSINQATSQKFLQVSESNGVLSFKLGNGSSMVCDVAALSAEMKHAALLHGVNQKVRDSAAGFSKDSDYAGAFRAMQSTWETLLSGLWNAKGGASGEPDLVQAVANLKKMSLDEARAIVDKLDDDQMKVLRSRPAVKAELLRIKSERAAKVAAAAPDGDEDILKF